MIPFGWQRNGPAMLLRRAAVLTAICATAVQAQEAGSEAGWIQLFNGRDLDGWTVKITGQEIGRDPARTFRVEDGILTVSYDNYSGFDGEFGHLFYQAPFSHYLLRVEYRFLGEQATGGPSWAFRNSGVMVHSQAPESMTREQAFPVSIEFQFLGGDGSNDRPTGNLCTPGTNVVMDGQLVTRHCTNSTAPTLHGNQWVRAEIEVHGDSLVRHIINGEKVLEYTKPQFDPNDADAQRLITGGKLALGRGYIALQAESHPIQFRKVELKRIGQ